MYQTQYSAFSNMIKYILMKEKKMDYSTKISERMWNQPDKGELEAAREQTFIDDIVQKSFI